MSVLIDRRGFLKSSAAAGVGLVIGFRWDSGLQARAAAASAAGDGSTLAPNAFLRIGSDDTVTVFAKHIEFGQGSHTGIATIVCEELDADWSRVRVEAAPADKQRFGNLFFPGSHQGTGGSSAMANSWQQLREAGATGRALLVSAAAAEWAVPESEIEVRDGLVRHAQSRREARFGTLAERAAELPVPAEVALKDPKDFRLIGKQVLRVDSDAKSRGRARYAMDLSGDDVLTALIARPPRFGSRVGTVDDAATKQIQGVVDVVALPSGVAVVADGFWAAKKGRDVLQVTWDEADAETRGSEDLIAEYRGLAQQPGAVVTNRGDAAAALADADDVVEAEFVFPFLAHAPMEPLSAVARLRAGRLQLALGSQVPTLDQELAASAVELPASDVSVETLFAGGSFGRRATPDSDVAVEAARLAKAVGGERAVKVVWSREDDIRGGRYRPIYVHRLRARLGQDGKPAAWEHRIVGQSIVGGTFFADAIVQDGIDGTSVEGARGLPYQIPNFRVELTTTENGVPPLWWRAVGHTHTAYSTEVVLDELAGLAGQDPIAYRLSLLGPEHARHRGVLEAVASAAGGLDAPEGRARGVALHESFGSFVAQIAEVSLAPDRMPTVHKVWCAVDCGIAINPDVIRGQMSGGLGFGLSAALHSEVVLDAGRVAPSNFHDYPSLRMSEMPEVEVVIVPSAESPTGVGEPGTPPIAPAVANAYRVLTGEPVRRLPFQRHVRSRAT